MGQSSPTVAHDDARECRRSELEVHLVADEEAGGNSSELRQTIEMSVAEMEDAIAIKGLWEVRKGYG